MARIMKRGGGGGSRWWLVETDSSGRRELSRREIDPSTGEDVPRTVERPLPTADRGIDLEGQGKLGRGRI